MKPVFLNYDLPSLELEYSGSERERHLDAAKAKREARINAQNATVIETRPRLLDFVYGTHPRQRIDYFPTEDPFAPLFVFIHGGYWKTRDKNMFSYLAPAFTDSGVNFAAIGYPLAPDVRMTEIVESCQRAIHWLLNYPSGLRFDPTRLHIGGHSAGGHLAAMMATTDWRHYGLPENTIKSVTCISGLYDLRPLALCRQHRDLGLDDAEVRALSPLQLTPPHPTPLISAVGSLEGDEFLRNEQALARAWKGRGLRVSRPKAPGFYHFNVLDELARRKSPLMKAVMAMIARK
jgi:arylformamidase